MPGRKLIATKLKLIQGTARKCRLNKKEPEVRAGRPIAPGHLSECALKAWDEFAGYLTEMGVLSTIDSGVLEGLAQTYSELLTAREALAQHGGAVSYSSVSQSGEKMWKLYPEVRLISDLDKRFRGWLSVCGLTPSDRGKVSSLGTQKQTDPWSDI